MLGACHWSCCYATDADGPCAKAAHTFAGAAQAREAAPSLAGWFAGWGWAALAAAPAATPGARGEPRAARATEPDVGDEPAGPVLTVGRADVPTDGARVYRDVQRVVLKRAVPCDGAARADCCRQDPISL